MHFTSVSSAFNHKHVRNLKFITFKDMELVINTHDAFSFTNKPILYKQGLC